ncbi:MAG TPA: pitrilysin family protein [Cytophagales bacterium]
MAAGGGPAFAQPKPADVQSFTLANGMKFLVLEDHSIPNANMYLFWKVGSRNEYPGITGLSHFFEHMMFNGARKYGPKMFDQVMENGGGSNNAYTTPDVTVYTDWFPSAALETMFDLESDRVRDLNFDDKMIESERGVVHSEWRTGLENSNFRALHQQLLSVAFFAHPYSWPVIGYESDIKNWRKEDLQGYFRTYYAPNNCVAVVVGDVRTERVQQLARQYFEPIAAHAPPRPVHTQEPPQQGEKRFAVQKDVAAPNVLIGWHVPAATSPDYYALSLLGDILSEGKSSRLYRSLVDGKQLATEVDARLTASLDPYLFTIFAVANPGVTADRLERALLDEIDALIKDGVAEKELQKVKNQQRVRLYRQLETINGKANNLGSHEVFFGDYGQLFAAPEKFARVSAEDVRRVAAQYFTKANRTVGVLQAKAE